MFLYTYSYLTGYQDFISDAQLFILVTAVLLLIWISTPGVSPKLPRRIPFSADFAYAFWYREVPLWQVFWPFRVILSSTMILMDTLVKSGITSVLLWDISQILFTVSSWWWGVAVWRASAYTRLRIWAFLARCTVLATFVEIVHRLIVRILYPRDFFVCSELDFNFTTCF